METSIKIVRLHFVSPLHIHGYGLDYAESERRIHSDTLYAAIIQMWRLLGYTSAIEATDRNDEDFSWTISSLFPFTQAVQADKIVYFLPRVRKMFDSEHVRRTFRDQPKLVKKIEWLDLEYFSDHLQKNGGTAPELGDIQHGIFLSRHKIPGFIESTVDARASIPRVNSSDDKTRPYVAERISFIGNSGMYFLFNGSDSAFSAVTKALELLQDEGIGSDRSLGNGRFFFETGSQEECKKFEALFKPASEYSTNISLFVPDSAVALEGMLNDDINISRIAYELKKRGGWITTEPFQTLQKQPVFMFGEGSVFRVPKGVHGTTIDVTPGASFAMPHPVKRIGRSLFVPINF
jgi:CRISPR-associated protein Csm4